MTHEGNVTTSELQFTPDVTDAGKVLSCEASAPSDNTRPLVDDWLLDIYCEYTKGVLGRTFRGERRAGRHHGGVVGGMEGVKEVLEGILGVGEV